MSFSDLSFVTVLALEQVSVINDLKENKGMQGQRKVSQTIVRR